MANVTEPGAYYYMQGWGGGVNRKIEFLREDPQDQKSIYAQVSRLEGKKWQPFTRLSGKDVNVEQTRVSKKVEALKERNFGQPTNLKKPDKPLEELEIKAQDAILEKIEPYGPWTLEIRCEPDPRTKLEKITYISIYNPN